MKHVHISLLSMYDTCQCQWRKSEILGPISYIYLKFLFLVGSTKVEED